MTRMSLQTNIAVDFPSKIYSSRFLEQLTFKVETNLST